ncbi:MAG TPA: OmpA family protein [Polyangiaceae bacterium]
MVRLRLVHACDARWHDMREAPGGRHCATCEKDVLDWTGATEDQARARLAVLGAKTACVRLRLDAYGRPLFAAMVAGALAGCAGSPPQQAVTSAPPPHGVELAPVAEVASAPAVQTAADADDDHDGVPNAVDACPYEPGPADSDPHRSGCRSFVGIIVSPSVVQVTARVAFARAQAKLHPGAKPVLDDIVAALAAHPDIVKMEVQGHASADEPDPQRLSESRARGVLARLVASGVDPARLVARGYGAGRPVASSSTEDGRAQNRAVSFEVVQTDP